MTPELRGLIATLRQGSPRWLLFTIELIRAAYALPPGENRATPVGPAVPVRPKKVRRNKSKLIFLLFSFSEGFECLRVAQFPKFYLSGRRRKRYPIVLASLPKLGHWNELRKPDVDQPLGHDRRLNQSPGLLARPVSIAVPVGGARRAPDTSVSSAGDRALNDDVNSSTHRRRC